MPLVVEGQFLTWSSTEKKFVPTSLSALDVVRRSGDTMTGDLRINARLGINRTPTTYKLEIEGGGDEKILLRTTAAWWVGGAAALLFEASGYTNSPRMEWQFIPDNNDKLSRLRLNYLGGVAFGDILALRADKNLGFNTLQFAGGEGVMAIANAVVAPTSTPTGAGVLYSQSGAGKWLGSSGTITTFGPAEPHCPDCGRDFVLEWENQRFGHLQICMWCVTESMNVMKRVPANSNE